MKSLPFLISFLFTSAAFAEPPSTQPQSAVSELVTKQLLAPLKKAESRRSRFSRAAPVAVERRVRVLDTVALTDRNGREFLRFAIDERRPWDAPGAWAMDSVVGCAYPSERAVFVRRGEAYRPARSMLGHEDTTQPDACRAAPKDGSQIATAVIPEPTRPVTP